MKRACFAWAVAFLCSGAWLVFAGDPPATSPAATAPATQPALVIVSARWGTGKKWLDVKQELQKRVQGDHLDMPLGPEQFASDPAPKVHKRLEVTYQLNGEKKSETFQGQTQLWIGVGPRPEGQPANDKVAAGAGGAAAKPVAKSAGSKDDALMPKVEQLRKQYGDGLIILEAKYGNGNRWGDVTEKLQSQVAGNALMARSSGENWGDPAPGSTKEVQITYWDGREIKHAKFGGGALIDIDGTKPEALLGLAPFPRYIIEGQAVVHSFAGKGTFTLTSGPKGMTLSPDGTVRWTPDSGQVGGQEFKFVYKAADKEYWDTQWCTVLSSTTTAAVQGDARKFDALMRLPVQTLKSTRYETPWEASEALIVDGDKLIVTGPDGLLPARTVPLKETYLRVGERKDYFMAVRPQGEDLLDKQTGKVIKTIPLSYQSFHDVAFKPDAEFTFLTVKMRNTVPRDQVVIVNESTGDVRAPRDLSGSFLQFDASGKHLWVGVKDIFETGTEYYINPDWNVIGVPTYGNIDMLLRFDCPKGQLVLKDKITQAGGNGSGIRVSPDGKRASYLSFTGYPGNSKTAPAWDGLDFGKEPVGYNMHGINGDGGPKVLSFHPFLPLVVIPKPGGVALFERDTGALDKSHLSFPAAALAATKVHEAWFSPDGENVIVLCEKSEGFWLQKLPLVLTAEERQKGSVPAGR